MAKILNLDALAAKEARELVLAGKTYVVHEMTVDDFIETSRIAQKLEGETRMDIQMTESIKLIKRGIPEIDESVLFKLNMEQLAAVAKFVRGEDPIEPASAPAEGGEQGKA